MKQDELNEELVLDELINNELNALQLNENAEKTSDITEEANFGPGNDFFEVCTICKYLHTSNELNIFLFH